MLEMFIALAERMENDARWMMIHHILWNGTSGRLVKNCGLYDYTDEALFNPRHEEEVDLHP